MQVPLQLVDEDLASTDGTVVSITKIDARHREAHVRIENISPQFLGFQIPKEQVFFNIKSTLAQLGLNGIGHEIVLDPKRKSAEVQVLLTAFGPVAEVMLDLLIPGTQLGKLFAADERRRVRDPDYLGRMFGRSDRLGKPLLSLGGLQGGGDVILERVDGRTVAYLTLQDGRVTYDPAIYGLLPTLAKALVKKAPMREILCLQQRWEPGSIKKVEEGEILLVKTLPLHVRTVFGRVVDELLPPGYHHTSASVLQPDTLASGDVYELFGNSKQEIIDIPLEFYTLEPYREHVFFSDRDQLQSCLEDNQTLFQAFDTAPDPKEHQAAVFIVKGEQLKNLRSEHWICRETRMQPFPGSIHGARQALMVDRYIQQQAAYPFLQKMDLGLITSQGVLFTRYFPSPLMKRMLLGDQVQRGLKGIYFQSPSMSHGNYFSWEDRALLHDLDKFAIPVYWVDRDTETILQYAQKQDRDSGLFVPLKDVERFLRSTLFGIYGSNLLEGQEEVELRMLFQGLLEMRFRVNHPLLNPSTPLGLVTGGGPGAMALGNKIAKDLGILSCANIVDFRAKDGSVVNEQKTNPNVEAKMTYRLDKLVERQAEFNLDFPIFLRGGIGTDFEYSLEEVRRKVGAIHPTPILLYGPKEYWTEKISSRFQSNLKNGTIKGSEWVSNCFFCVQNSREGLTVYERFFQGTLPIGKEGPLYENGFGVLL